MSASTNPSSKTTSRRYFAMFLIFAAIQGLACLVWLFTIPTDGKNAVIGGYSAQRLALGALLLVPALFCLVAAINRKTQAIGTSATARILRSDRSLYTTTGLVLGAGLLGLGLLMLPPSRFGSLQYAFTRVKPLVTWPVLICWQTALVLLWTTTRRNQAVMRSLATDFTESLAFLPTRKTLILMLLLGILAGSLAAFTLRGVGSQVLASVPWIAAPGLLFGVILLACGLLYNRSLVRLIPVGTLFLLAAVLAVNARITPNRVEKSNAIIQTMNDGSAIALGKQYHYSLSVYHILSLLYPNSTFHASPELLKKWNLDKDALSAWVPAAQIAEGAASPQLNDSLVEAIMRRQPVEVEINTIEGSRYYYFISGSASSRDRVTFAEYGNKRFVLPEALLAQLLKEQGAAH